MIISMAPEKYPTIFEKEHSPKLLHASHVTVGFSDYPRLLHKHDDRMELMLIRSGFGTYVVGDKKYNVEQGNIIVCNQGVLHDEMPEYNHNLSMLGVAVSGVKVKGLPENTLFPTDVLPFLRSCNNMRMLEAMFETIYDSLSSGNTDEYENANYLTQALVSQVAYSGFQYGTSQTGQTKIKDQISPFIDVKHYIDDNYAEDLSIQLISERFHLSQSYLSHLFKRRIGFSPNQYINRRRIGEAQLLLVLSELSITEIATRVGFKSLSHFNSQFKRCVGMNPSVYRKENIVKDSY